jgi:hypothetical protein
VRKIIGLRGCRLRRVGIRAALSGCVLVLASCGSVPAGGTASEASLQPTPEEDIQVECTDIPFPGERLVAAPGAETGSDGPAAALRAFLATSEQETFPRSGWIKVVQTGDTAQFVAHDSQMGLDLVALHLRNGQWKPYHIGECRLRPAIGGGLFAGSWWLATGTSLEPGDHVFDAFASEFGCRVGPPRPAAVGDPVVAHRSDQVKIVVPVQRDVNVDCATGPTAIRIDIGEPLGNRRLVDAAEFPPRDARKAPS